MAPTRAGLETALISRWALHMMAVGLDTARSGANSDLDDALREGAVAAGLATADPLVLADSDVTFAGGPGLTMLLIVAELRLVDLLLARWPYAKLGDIPEERRGKAYESMQAELRKRRDELECYARDPLAAPEGPSVGRMTPVVPIEALRGGYWGRPAWPNLAFGPFGDEDLPCP